MRAVFFPAGPETFASARFRAYWVARYWNEAEVHTQGPLQANEYDVFIFQKVFWRDAARDAARLRNLGKTVAWDLCDPAWWTYPDQHTLMAEQISFGVACSRALAELAEKELGITCHVIPDRHDPEYHPRVKIHRDKERLRFVWFGFSGNRFVLNAVLPFLERLKVLGKSFELMVVDEHPEIPMTGLPCPVIHKQWDLSTFNADILNADAALLPPHPEPLGRYKSNNKEMTASWCGLPVVSGVDWDELLSVFDPGVRAEAGRANRERAEKEYDVRLSVKDWQELLQCSPSV